MKRWLPAPLLSAALFALWLMLQESLSPAHLLLGGVLAVLLPRLMAPLRPPSGPVRRPLVLARLILTVGHDVVLSALQVAHGTLRARWRPPRGRFVLIPLELRDEHALAALSVITAVVPGTVWCELAPDRSALLLHVFDVGDEAAFVNHYKQRYERPLREIFQ
ncbi:Na+/H+ antiporter subunit E [uncultured Azohydromonas sp.]|jgi:Multisubunit Na+/H+ antiporter, MnhE subunit|uniref:Na+/H+ antiporter subunit E n=1 Tax=uncultured Azohydromonas sp. TaxID=487342 RepID=UPI0026298DFB|nr:Na+/H+ antiporter subunit E [uncultured Azohydromonas sp.]